GDATVRRGSVGGPGAGAEVRFTYPVKLSRVQADASLPAEPLAIGVRVVNLVVSAPHKAHILVRCTRGCRSQARAARAVSFPRLRGTILTNGSALKIYVTHT